MSNGPANTSLRAAAVLGLLASICYGLSTHGGLPFKWDYGLFFAFGPLLAAVGLCVYHVFQYQQDGLRLQIASLFIILAGVTFTVMATMQGAILWKLRRMQSSVDSDVFTALNAIVPATQLGVDMAFDLFISAGTFLLGMVLWCDRRFGVWFGLPAMLVPLVGIAFNMATFPLNSGTAGLIDPGPWFGVFYGAFTIRLFTLWCKVPPVAKTSIANALALILVFVWAPGCAAGRSKAEIEAEAHVTLVKTPAPDIALCEFIDRAASPLKGSVTLLNFWAYWCPPCMEELPLLEAFHAKHSPEGRIQVVGVTGLRAGSDDAREHRKILAAIAKNDLTYAITICGQTCHDYKIERWPTTVLVDQTGAIVDYAIGEDGTRRLMALAEVLAGSH